MAKRLVLTLHLDEFELAQGGGWAEFAEDGELVEMRAYPGLPEADMLPHDAVLLLLGCWQDAVAEQLPLFT